MPLFLSIQKILFQMKSGHGVPGCFGVSPVSGWMHTDRAVFSLVMPSGVSTDGSFPLIILNASGNSRWLWQALPARPFQFIISLSDRQSARMENGDVPLNGKSAGRKNNCHPSGNGVK